MVCTWIFLALLGSQKPIGANFGKAASTVSWERTSNPDGVSGVARMALSKLDAGTALDFRTALLGWRAAARKAHWPEFCPKPLKVSVGKVDQTIFRQIDAGQLKLSCQFGEDDLFAWQGTRWSWTSIYKLRQSQLLYPHRVLVASSAEVSRADMAAPPPRQVVVATLPDQNTKELIGPLSGVAEMHGPPVSQQPADSADLPAVNAPNSGRESPSPTGPFVAEPPHNQRFNPFGGKRDAVSGNQRSSSKG